MSPLLPLLIWACTASDDPADSGPVDSPVGPAPLACEPPQIAMSQEWTDVDLPKQRDPPSGLVGVGLGDLDGDGDLDALLGYPGGSVLFLNDGAGQLTQAADFTVEGQDAPWAMSAELADLDGDGDLDAHLGRWGEERDLILRNGGDLAFTAEPLDGSEGATFSGAFADADGDGDLDLFVAAGAMEMEYEAITDGTQKGDPNRLYLQGHDGRFTLAPDNLPEDSLYGMSFHGAWLDAEGDGDLDVYVANDAGPFLDPNHLLLNDGAGRFSRHTDCACELEMFGMGAAVGDANFDGLADLFVTDVGPPNLLQGQGDATYVDVTLASGAEIPATESSMTSWGTAFADMDQDRCPDLLVTYGPSSGRNFDQVMEELGWVDGEEQPDVLLWSTCDGSFERDTTTGFADPGSTRAVAVGDLDGDGRPDAVTAGRGFMRTWLTSGGCPPGATIRLDAGPGNRQGIGARADVTAGGLTTTHWMLPSTTGSSSAPEIYAGFGYETADEIAITWPDGHRSALTDVPAGSVLELTR